MENKRRRMKSEVLIIPVEFTPHRGPISTVRMDKNGSEWA